MIGGYSSTAGAEPQSGAAAGREQGQDQGQPADDQKPDQRSAAAGLLPSISTPVGGGAVRGLGENFSVTAATGAGGFTMALPLTPGRSGFTPALGLGYDSGAGNGPFGFGWNCGTPAITRKTDKGLPQYRDGDESDVFLLSGAEDLVPVLDSSGARATLERTVYGTAYRIARYRPRVESGFARIERWTAVSSGLIHWRTLSRDNVTTLYGSDPGSTVAAPPDPAEPTAPARIYNWNICRSWDDRGNAALYSYLPEDSAGIDTAAAHEANRTVATRATQVYLKTVQYGNLQPYLPDWTAAEELPLPTDWLFSVVLDYGDHTAVPPTVHSDQPWPLRPDPFSGYRAGFEVRTYRRVQRLLFFHHFPAEPTAGADCLVRSVDLVYSDQQTPADPTNPIYTLLASATQTGYQPQNQGAVSRSLPPLEFTYSAPQIQQQVQSLDADSLGNLPEGLDGTRYRFADLDGEGSPGILADAGSGWYYKRNLSPDNLVAQPDGALRAQARFGLLESVAAIPSRSDLTGVQLLDLTGSGRLDVVDLSGADAGYFERTEDYGFIPFQRFAALPQLDWSEPNLRFIDLTGDGLADILMTEDGAYTYYASLCGPAGFDSARLERPGWDEERGPAVILADGTQTVFTADMSGDGLSDIVRVRNGEACYWPNLGYGRFGAKVTMDGAPRFDDQERFDPARIRLADIDGAGTADLLYIGAEGVTAWFNQSGNAWSAPTVIGVFPSADQLGSVEVLDLLGTGTACLVWSSPLPGQSAAPLLYVDLMGGQKPHLLTGVRNNLGAETRVAYAPSTRYYVADELAGTPWATRLPFPVQVVERCETFDWIGRNRLVTRYAYHHGYFDAFEREYRGFGLVEQWDTEEFRADTAFDDGDAVNWDQQSWSPPVLTRTWFHTGAFAEAQAVSQQYQSEYWTEPALRAPALAADAAAMRPPDTVIPGGLDPFEVQEAYRSLKGQPLRTEVYAQDATAAAANPYTVTEQNFTVSCLQNTGPNLHAVFFVHPRETLSLRYERGAADPRIGHDLILEADAYGNVLRSVSVGYPRRGGYAPPEPALSPATQQMLAYDQSRLHLVGVEHDYTNPIDDPATWPDAYRVPLLAGALTAEITGPAPSVKGSGITNLYSYAEIDGAGGIWPSVWTGTADIPYEQLPGSDVDGSGTPATPTRRPIAQRAVLYRSDDLTALLPAGQLQTRALIGESYTAALTPGQLSAILGSQLAGAALTAVLAEGGYVQLPGSAYWWIPSGRVYLSPGDGDTPAQELAAARGAFFLPRRAVDPYGAVTRAAFDSYNLLPVSLTDPVGNVTAADADYRVLAPAMVTDANGNRVATAFDALGLATASAVMGKSTETLGDLLTGFTTDLDAPTLIAQFDDPLADPAAILGNATSRYLYDVTAYQRTATAAQPSPPAAYALARETHVSDLAAPPYPGAAQTTAYQYRITYGDGYGREIQRKTLAAPGPISEGGPQVSPRWTATGWSILDNKGRTVRRYEPFFTAACAFEFAAQTGVSTVVLYDPLGRAVASLRPDDSWEKAVIGPWLSWSWDADDTTRIDDPRTDADVGAYFQRLLGTAPFTSWYEQRIGGGYGATPEQQAAQQDAAKKAAGAAGTATAAHYDSLGRACLSVGDAGGGNRYPSRTALDTQSRPLAVFDALGRRVEEYCFRDPQAGGGFRYLAGADMAGRQLYHVNADGGARRTMLGASGLPIRSWDARGHAFRLVYDAAQRPTHRYVSTNGAAEILLDLGVYGEGQSGANLCGREFRHYDTAGYAENTAYDYKGNPLTQTRQLAVAYEQSVDWSPLAALTTGAQLDAAAQSAGLIPTGDGGRDKFTGTTLFDALNRPIQQISARNSTMNPEVGQPGYDQGGLLTRLDVWYQQTAVPTALLDPSTADLHAVTSLAYNARNQRIQAAQGNGADTSYSYDPLTFRLTRLTTTRPSSFAADQQTVQDLSYYYDPVGNPTRIQDDADTQDVVFFDNRRVEPSASYTYDALYRLVAATGREHLGQTGGALSAPQQVTNDDSFRLSLPQPGDGNAMGTYTESYVYDPAGNLQSMAHQAGPGGWTRRYSYAEASQIVAGETGNRLSATSLPGDASGGPYSARQTYDAHGNMTQMPHLPAMVWDEGDRLRSTLRQVATTGMTPQTAYYVYDGNGRRIRKVTNAQAAAGNTPTRSAERIYLGGLELYREYGSDGTTVTLERETLHVNDGSSIVTRIEVRTIGTDNAPARLLRYQYGNHLGSSTLELDDQSNILSYEEYFPYGSTSYQAVASQTDLPKRYRYTGKERDAENDLYYHGARYYAPWLGRWTACDPIGLGDGLNVYAYVRGNPVALTDPGGTEGQDSKGPMGRANPQLVKKDTFTGKETQDQVAEKYAEVGIHYAGNAVWDAGHKMWWVDRSQVYDETPNPDDADDSSADTKGGDQSDQGQDAGDPDDPDDDDKPSGDDDDDQEGNKNGGDGQGEQPDALERFAMGVVKGAAVGLGAVLLVAAIPEIAGAVAIVGVASLVLGVGELIAGKDLDGNPVDRADLGGQLVGGALVGGLSKGLLETPEVDLGSGETPAGPGDPVSLDPNTIRHSQTGVNDAAEIIDNMKANGWVGDPIDVVQMPDGELTTVDNTRVTAARHAEIDVKARVHPFDELLPDQQQIDRFTTKKGVPKTWGDAVRLRVGKQSSAYRKTWPMGSPYTGWDGN